MKILRTDAFKEVLSMDLNDLLEVAEKEIE
jgi:hypothetical protein